MADAFQNVTVCAPCEDSDLSIWASCIGILTFALAIAAAAGIRVSLLRKAVSETQWMIKKIRLQREILEWQIKKVQKRNDNGSDKWTDAQLRTFVNTADQAAQLQSQLEGVLRRDSCQPTVSWRLLSTEVLTLGIRFMLRREELNSISQQSDQMLGLLNSLIDAAPENDDGRQNNFLLDHVLRKLEALERSFYQTRNLWTEQLHLDGLPEE